MSKINQLQDEIQDLKKQLGYTAIPIMNTNHIGTGEEIVYCTPYITIAEQIDAICKHLGISIVRVESHINIEKK